MTTVAGRYKLNVDVNGVSCDIPDAAKTATVAPDAAYALASSVSGDGLRKGRVGEINEFRVIARDRYGNRRISGDIDEDEFDVSAQSLALIPVDGSAVVNPPPFEYPAWRQSLPVEVEEKINIQPYQLPVFGGVDSYYYPISYFTKLALNVRGNVIVKKNSYLIRI